MAKISLRKLKNSIQPQQKTSKTIEHDIYPDKDVLIASRDGICIDAKSLEMFDIRFGYDKHTHVKFITNERFFEKHDISWTLNSVGRYVLDIKDKNKQNKASTKTNIIYIMGPYIPVISYMSKEDHKLNISFSSYYDSYNDGINYHTLLSKINLPNSWNEFKLYISEKTLPLVKNFKFDAYRIYKQEIEQFIIDEDLFMYIPKLMAITNDFSLFKLLLEHKTLKDVKEMFNKEILKHYEPTKVMFDNFINSLLDYHREDYYFNRYMMYLLDQLEFELPVYAKNIVKKVEFEMNEYNGGVVIPKEYTYKLFLQGAEQQQHDIFVKNQDHLNDLSFSWDM